MGHGFRKNLFSVEGCRKLELRLSVRAIAPLFLGSQVVLSARSGWDFKHHPTPDNVFRLLDCPCIDDFAADQGFLKNTWVALLRCFGLLLRQNQTSAHRIPPLNSDYPRPDHYLCGVEPCNRTEQIGKKRRKELRYRPRLPKYVLTAVTGSDAGAIPIMQMHVKSPSSSLVPHA